MFKSKSIIYICLIIAIIYLIYKWWNNKTIDSFENSTPQTTSNMINNPNFEDGKKPDAMYLNGNSTIVTGENPGKTSYYLNIARPAGSPQSNEDPNYAGLRYEVANHTKYLFSCICGTKNPTLSGTINPNGLINITVRTGTGTLLYPETYFTTTPLNGNQQGITWYKFEFVTNMEVDGGDKVMLEIMFGRNAQQEIRMFTDLFLGQQIIGLGPIPVNSNLNGAYLAYSTASYTLGEKVWKDLSGKGYDINFDVTPGYNTTEKAFDIKTTTGTGPFASNWIGSEQDFTIVLYGKSLSDSLASPAEAITIPGNNINAVKCSLPNDSSKYPMKLIVADLQGPDMLVQLNQTYVMFIEYTQSDTTCRITLNDADSPSFQFNANSKVYGSTTRNIILNAAKQWNSLLYGTLIYQQILSTQQKKDTNTYLRTKDTGSIKYPPSGYTKYDQIPIVKPIPTPRQDCYNLCMDRCSNKVGVEYNSCINSCRTDIPECNNMCSLPINSNNPICSPGANIRPDCPIVIFKNGNYIIIIDQNSVYARQLGRYGEISYGSDRQKAASIYSMNFPGCPLPPILIAIAPPDPNQMASCPFHIRDNNPCATDACNAMKWTSGLVQDGMQDQCKRNINHYCELYHNLDPACKCWDPTNQNTEQCQNIINNIRKPYDENCRPGSYPISQHPEFSQYIRKDRIPCWGCDIK